MSDTGASAGDVLAGMGFTREACVDWQRKIAASRPKDLGYLARQAEYHMLEAATAERGSRAEQLLLGIAVKLEGDCSGLPEEFVERSRDAARQSHYAQDNRIQRIRERIAANSSGYSSRKEPDAREERERNRPFSERGEPE